MISGGGGKSTFRGIEGVGGKHDFRGVNQHFEELRGWRKNMILGGTNQHFEGFRGGEKLLLGGGVGGMPLRKP